MIANILTVRVEWVVNNGEMPAHGLAVGSTVLSICSSGKFAYLSEVCHGFGFMYDIYNHPASWCLGLQQLLRWMKVMSAWHE